MKMPFTVGLVLDVGLVHGRASVRCRPSSR